jgi:hypothetical protein
MPAIPFLLLPTCGALHDDYGAEQTMCACCGISACTILGEAELIARGHLCQCAAVLTVTEPMHAQASSSTAGRTRSWRLGYKLWAGTAARSRATPATSTRAGTAASAAPRATSRMRRAPGSPMRPSQAPRSSRVRACAHLLPVLVWRGYLTSYSALACWTLCMCAVQDAGPQSEVRP